MNGVRRAVRWRPADRHARLLALGIGTLFGTYFGLYAVSILGQAGPFRFGDFFALWSYGQVLAAHPAAELYEPSALVARQVALGMAPSVSDPFPYPPNFLPFVWPLGYLSYTQGYVAFIGATFGLYVVAIVAGTPKPRAPLALVAILAPTSVITLVAGQSGFLAAALFLGGMRLAPTRPVLGGVLLGLLAYKPQLGLLVPVALAAAGQFRCIATAAGTVAAVALATSAGFGWYIWADWVGYLPAYAGQFERESTEITYLMPTLGVLLGALHVPAWAIGPAQAALALAAAIWVWRASRRGPAARALLVLATATFLASPHSFVYDLPMLTGAVLLFIDHRFRGNAGLATGEVAALLLALIFPAIMVHAGSTVPLGAACLGVLAATLIAYPAEAAAA